MKKSFNVYTVIWAICLVVFNVIVFVVPTGLGISKFGGSFWVGYIFITVAFLGQLACAFIAFKAENIKTLFYNIPLISISYSGLIAMLIAGGVFIAIPVLPEWIGIVVCIVILAVNAIAIIKAKAAANIVKGIDEKVKAKTFFIKSLTVDASSLVACAKTDELRTEARRVYEVIRYSDPVANAELSSLDSQIEKQFAVFADTINEQNTQLAKTEADTLVQMLERRNRKCKLLK